MPEPDRSELVLYGQVLQEIKMREAEVVRWLARNVRTVNTFHANYVAMHLRTMIEFVALGSLVANRPDVERVASAFHKKDADAAAKVVKQINPRYWPRPSALIVSDDPAELWHLETLTEGFLREEDWRAAWGFLSTLLHATNPYVATPSKPRPDLVEVFKRLRDIHLRIARLLARHEVHLVDQNVVLLVQMEGEDGRLHVQSAVRSEPI
jgi:hypothetical protein